MKILLILFSMFALLAQGQEVEHVVVLNNMDSLVDVKVLKQYKYTNHEQVTYELNGEKITATPEEIYAYNNGEEYFLSRKVYPIGSKKFITYLNYNYLKIGRTNEPNGKIEFFAQFGEEDLIHRIKNYKGSLDSLFKAKLPDYESFMKIYDRKVFITKESLTHFAGAYNDFDPDYEFYQEEYYYEGRLSFGLLAGVSVGTLSWNNSDWLTTLGPPAGVLMEIQYTDNFALNNMFVHDYFHFTGPADDIRVPRITYESYGVFKHSIRENLSLNYGAGGFFALNYSSKFFTPTDFVGTELREFTGGFRLSVDLEYRKRFMAMLTMLQGNVPAKFGIFNSFERANATLRIYRLTFLYFLN